MQNQDQVPGAHKILLDDTVQNSVLFFLTRNYASADDQVVQLMHLSAEFLTLYFDFKEDN